MMETGVAHTGADGHIVNIHSGQKQSSVIPQAQAVAEGTVTKEQSIGMGTVGGNRRIRALHPGFDGEVLQMEVGWIADGYSVGASIQDKGLADTAGTEGRIASQRSVVGAGLIERVAFTAPPTDAAGWRRGTWGRRIQGHNVAVERYHGIIGVAKGDVGPAISI